jgi:hypothetical protein
MSRIGGAFGAVSEPGPENREGGEDGGPCRSRRGVGVAEGEPGPLSRPYGTIREGVRVGVGVGVSRGGPIRAGPPDGVGVGVRPFSKEIGENLGTGGIGVGVTVPVVVSGVEMGAGR